MLGLRSGLVLLASIHVPNNGGLIIDTPQEVYEADRRFRVLQV